MGGGVYHSETDVHIVAFRICPRCGELDCDHRTGLGKNRRNGI
jgi:hypothetical protein